MNNSTLIIATEQMEDEFDMFSDLEPLSAFEVKRDSVATHLTALMIHCGKSRSAMAEELGWKKSRVTNVLSGKSNLTLKTICDFSTHLGFDFDVVFHGIEQPKPKQPWQIEKPESTSIFANELWTLTLPLKSKRAQEVADDFRKGLHNEMCFYFDTSGFQSSNETLLPIKSYEVNPIKVASDDFVLYTT